MEKFFRNKPVIIECANSTYRDKLISLLDGKVPLYNPNLKVEYDLNEARFIVFMMVGDTIGAYSVWKLHKEVMKDPSKIIFCTEGKLSANKGIKKIKRELAQMGSIVLDSVEEVACLLEQAYYKG